MKIERAFMISISMKGLYFPLIAVIIFWQLSMEEQEEQEDEDRAIGKISWRAYRDFFRAGAPYYVIFLVFVMCLLSQAAYNIADWWLAVWSVLLLTVIVLLA